MMQAESANFVITASSADGWPILEAEAIEYLQMKMCRPAPYDITL